MKKTKKSEKKTESKKDQKEKLIKYYIKKIKEI